MKNKKILTQKNINFQYLALSKNKRKNGFELHSKL